MHCSCGAKHPRGAGPARSGRPALPCVHVPSSGSRSRQLHTRSSTLSDFSSHGAASLDAQISNALNLSANTPQHKRQPVAGRHGRTRPRLLPPSAASRPGPPRTGKPLRAAARPAALCPAHLPPALPAPLRADFPKEQRGRAAHRFSRAAVPEARGSGTHRSSSSRGATADAHPRASSHRCFFLTSPASAARHAPVPLRSSADRRTIRNEPPASSQIPRKRRGALRGPPEPGKQEGRPAARPSPARPSRCPRQPRGAAAARSFSGARHGAPRGTDPTSGADAAGAARSSAVTL